MNIEFQSFKSPLAIKWAVDLGILRANVRPSALPMLAQCPKFDGEGGEYADAGTGRHRALEAILLGGDPVNELIPFDDDHEGILWAADYIRLHAPMADYPLIPQFKVNPVDDFFKLIFPNGGTTDFVCGSHIFDFKWRPRDYSPQMAAYALGLIHARYSDTPTVTTHLLFGATKRPAVNTWSEASALALIHPIIDAARNPDAKPVACDYCDWCKNKTTCPALTAPVAAIANVRRDSVEPDLAAKFSSWALDGAHTSQIDDPDLMSMVLKIARRMGPFCNGAEHRAKQMAVKDGRTLPGFELKPKAGKSYCTDIAAAFTQSGLDQSEFLQACDVRLNTSKKYHDKKGLINLVAAKQGTKIAPTKRALLAKLGDAITKGKDSVSLVEIGKEDNSEEETEKLPF